MNLMPMNYILEKILYHQGELATPQIKEELEFFIGKFVYRQSVERTLRFLKSIGVVKDRWAGSAHGSVKLWSLIDGDKELRSEKILR